MQVFVYGTLKAGYGNNSLLQGSKFVREDRVKGYKLFNCGFPVATPDANSSVKGEVWEIDPSKTLQWLDRLEGNGRMYNRTEVPEGVSLYVGHPEFWDFSKLRECSKDEFGNYYWDREQ